MIVGYARTSTVDQTAGLDAQRRDLEGAGCERIFEEQVSSVDKAKRQELLKAVDYVRDGDTLVVTKPDRLARSVAHLNELASELQTKNVTLRILSMDLDTSTPTGRLLLNLLGSISEFERDIMLERQREGIAKAKAAGKYQGRKPTARAKADQIRGMSDGGYTRREIAEALSVSQRSVYRILSQPAG